MGAEARTTLTLGRQTFAGTAHLESDELRFRGDHNLRIPLPSVSAVDVIGDSLQITHSDGVAVFGLGEALAAKWAQRIRSPRTLADKLGVKPGMVISVLGISDESVLEDIVARGGVMVKRKVPAAPAMVLWRIEKASELSKLASIAERIARDGAIWVVHPRGNADVADTVIFGAAKRAGLTYTKVVRFSETDTAEKLVIPVAAR